MTNKRIIAFISVFVVLCMSFSVVAYAGDFDLPIIGITGKTSQSGGSTHNDGGWTTPSVPIDPTTTTKPKTTKATTKAVVVKAPTLKKAAPGKKALTAKFTYVKGVKGYQIQVATNKKFTKNKKKATAAQPKKNAIISKKVSKLKSKKTYYVRVRAYKVVKGKTYYSKWSNVKTAKVK